MIEKDKFKKLIANFVICNILIFTALLLIPTDTYAKTLIVGVNYPTIREAMEKAKDGDLIEVRGGEHEERLRIQKSIHLRGINNPVIRVQDGNIIEVSSSGVVIEGFTLRYKGSRLAPTDTAIYIFKGADGVVVRNNH